MKTLDLAKAFQLNRGCQSTAYFLNPMQVRLVDDLDEPIHSNLRASFSTLYEEVLEFCKALELPVSEASCGKILELLSSEHTATGRWLHPPTRALVDSVQIELQSRLFLYVSYQHATFYKEPLAGWDKLRDAFPSAVYEVEEAAKCLALHRSTACVFHLRSGIRPVCAGLPIPSSLRSQVLE